MEQKEVTLKLADGYEFVVDSVNVNYNPATKAKSVTFIQHFADGQVQEIEERLTPENLQHISVFKNGGKIYELEGYTEITSMDVNIDRLNQVFTVRAVSPKQTD